MHEWKVSTDGQCKPNSAQYIYLRSVHTILDFLHLHLRVRYPVVHWQDTISITRFGYCIKYHQNLVYNGHLLISIQYRLEIQWMVLGNSPASISKIGDAIFEDGAKLHRRKVCLQHLLIEHLAHKANILNVRSWKLPRLLIYLVPLSPRVNSHCPCILWALFSKIYRNKTKLYRNLI